MVIDSHTHIFPDPVAQKAIPELAALIKARPAMDGTVNGLLESMENGDIDISIVLPIVTHPHQFDSILRFAVHLNETYSAGRRRIHSLASVHPLEPAFAEQRRRIRREGVTGIKIHPPYQGVELNDSRYKRIIEKASELGLYVTTHAGFDVYCPHHNYCSVDMILEVLHDVAPPALVAAHLGNNSYYDEVEKSSADRISTSTQLIPFFTFLRHSLPASSGSTAPTRCFLPQMCPGQIRKPAWSACAICPASLPKKKNAFCSGTQLPCITWIRAMQAKQANLPEFYITRV